MNTLRKILGLAAITVAAVFGYSLARDQLISPPDGQETLVDSGRPRALDRPGEVEIDQHEQAPDIHEKKGNRPPTAVLNNAQVRALRENYAEVVHDHGINTDPSPDIEPVGTTGPSENDHSKEQADQSHSQSHLERIKPSSEIPEGDTGAVTEEVIASPAIPQNDLLDLPRLWLPAAMLEPDESIVITSELQVAEWEQLQEDFVEAVDGAIPSDPVSEDAWIRAQEYNDDLFRLKFGVEAFQAQQLKAYREGLAPQQP